MAQRNRRYLEYINSARWQTRRRAFMAIRGNGSCAVCRTRSKLHVHHLHYNNLGEELDQDLMTLCEGHHAMVHNLQRSTGMTLPRATQTIVQGERGKTAPDLTPTAPPKPRQKKKAPKAARPATRKKKKPGKNKLGLVPPPNGKAWSAH